MKLSNFIDFLPENYVATIEKDGDDNKHFCLLTRQNDEVIAYLINDRQKDFYAIQDQEIDFKSINSIIIGYDQDKKRIRLTIYLPYEITKIKEFQKQIFMEILQQENTSNNIGAILRLC